MNNFQRVCLDSELTFCIYDTIFTYKRVVTHNFLQRACMYWVVFYVVSLVTS